ncbi:hypothetical protein VCRA2114E365_100055 [Vibrio crassostreae]|nr:hypothetical protein VCRA2113O363_100055 [Vibrio crassostreae]CAK1697797.1 hypothetical protein VCRA2113O359_100056 [Vibrio crassostreae]CAK2117443.1 hypothetical protein VCRA2113O351_40238 [Vibrio crassostreae]CAK2237890.1 hypothetical protein VCRA2113O361_100056 [Vibrio crassostreae]CAK2388943.1 hypothetical protein VCRA2119O386_80056 [Vibrio crassostreae]
MKNLKWGIEKGLYLVVDATKSMKRLISIITTDATSKSSASIRQCVVFFASTFMLFAVNPCVVSRGRFDLTIRLSEQSHFTIQRKVFHLLSCTICLFWFKIESK